MSGRANAAVAEIEAFIEQWIATLKDVRAAIDRKDFASAPGHVSFSYIRAGGNYVNYTGHRHLRNAVESILVEEGLTRRLSALTMEKFLVEEFFAELERQKKRRKFSVHALIARSKERLSTIRWSDGFFVFPVLFAPRATESNFHVGPARLISKKNLLEDYREMFDGEEACRSVESRRDFYGDWLSYIQRYDHFIVVELRGYEWELAWETGREIAEYVLNLVRMSFGFYHTQNIKIAGGYMWEATASKLMITHDDEAVFSSSRGPWGSHLDDSWADSLERNLGGMSGTWASLCAFMASGLHADTPVFERQRYAHQLISEAYCEPHDHIRLVRITSALEAIAIPEATDKSRSLAWNCAQAGGFSDPERALAIEAAVMRAYKVRNKIVHGDGASSEEIGGAFRELEKYLLAVIAGYTMLYVGIWNVKSPKHIGHLRAELRKRISLFYWDADLAFFEG